jgi:hypothetical protein
MIGIDLKPELQELVDNIARKNMYSGNKIPESIMKMFSIEITELHDGILVPYWLGVLERGRGPRKTTTDHKLYLKIKAWMTKRNMFNSKTAKGQENEAKRMTWYINHWGNKQFNRGNPIFVDIYNKERKITIEKINKKFSDKISKITMEVL